MSRRSRGNDDFDFLNMAFCEDESGVYCDICGGEIMFNPIENEYYCKECEQTMTRKEFFNFIGAEKLPGRKCYTCEMNYPLCRSLCSEYEITD